MTAPTSEYLRDLADNSWPVFDPTNEVRNALRAAADEVDRLRVVIKNAPHQHDCSTQTHAGDCDCWKADSLG